MKKIILGILLLVAIIAVALSQIDFNKEDEGLYTVYLANKEMNGLIAEKVPIDGTSIGNKIDNIFQVLKTGTEKGKATVPKSIEYNDLDINDKKVTIKFGESYTAMNDIEEIICRSSIVKSLTELSEIESVEFYIGSAPYMNSNGKVLGAMKSSDVVLDLEEEMSEKSKITVTLYFADQDSMYLIPVKKEIEVNPQEPIEKTVLELLIKGPEQKDLIPTIPSGTKIKNIYTNEGICYVDFNEDFVTKHSGGSSGEAMTIYSIVNTLTELNNISKVQFLIEGNIREEYKGHIQFDIMFQSNLDIIYKQEEN